MKCSCGNDKFKKSVQLVTQKGKTAIGLKSICTRCGAEEPEEKMNADYEIF